MVLTPQLLQAIKLLQMPNLELTQFIENELASNPLLERAEEREEPSSEPTDLPASPKRRPNPAIGPERRWRRTQGALPPISARRSTTPSTPTEAPRRRRRRQPTA